MIVVTLPNIAALIRAINLEIGHLVIYLVL